MRRRTFIKGMLAAGGGVAGLRLPVAMGAGYRDYAGKLLVSVQAYGGWDPTCFCDPKTNTPGSPSSTTGRRTMNRGRPAMFPTRRSPTTRRSSAGITRACWSSTASTCRPNAHDIGTVHTWTGRTSEAFPTLSAVHAAHNAPDAALACISFGAYSRGAALLPIAGFGTGGSSSTQQLAAIANPAEGGYLREKDWANIRRYHAQTTARLRTNEEIIPAAYRTRAAFESAFADEGGLADFVTELNRIDSGDPWGATVAAFKSGVSVSADLVYGFFDTHDDNDDRQAGQLAGLTGRIDELWRRAEEHGLADRLVVGRRLRVRSHQLLQRATTARTTGQSIASSSWRRTSPWTDRVVAATDDLHFAQPIDPQTLEPDPDGAVIYPNAVHKALRRHLGLEDSTGASLYPFRGVPDMAFFEA